MSMTTRTGSRDAVVIGVDDADGGIVAVRGRGGTAMAGLHIDDDSGQVFTANETGQTCTLAPPGR